MTERIDLDDVEVETDDEGGDDGDWLWRDDDAEDIDGDRGTAANRSGSPATQSDESHGSGAETDSEAGGDVAGDAQGNRIPHVPREGSSSPAGIPKDRGGSGAGASADQSGQNEGGGQRDETEAGTADEASAASGPHGGGVDEMATAYTFEAVQRLADPRLALGETNEWSDWVGLVGDVPAHAINAFLREHQLDIDFFNGSGDGPAERLAAIDEHSMFYSERMVVVGTDDEQWIAEDADWEFVAVEEAAERAGWSLSE
ncbi:DUF7124 domain-containing protein [Halobacterium bonnevillei]|uniref:DUF7124 domain-containing protein n=1 Tax=Halobacterium bonnevillei TaxID=2692200 RepID=A0A6B0SXW1_9EURY|nr:hypothetical protein [Halobacterium bonnevillei]MXR22219.1 hypothetical protein [Halobacterium bonnevillei]